MKYSTDELKEMIDDELEVDIGECQVCEGLLKNYVSICGECFKEIVDELIKFREEKHI